MNETNYPELISKQMAALLLRSLAERIEKEQTIRVTVIEHKDWRRPKSLFPSQLAGEEWLTVKWETK